MQWLELLLRELKQNNQDIADQILGGLDSFDKYQMMIGMYRQSLRAIAETQDMINRAYRADDS
jgi:hypothetical protein